MPKFTAAVILAATTVLGVTACETDDLATDTVAAQDHKDVQMNAHPAPFVPSIIHSAEPATAVQVPVTNISPDKALTVNPLDFSITDTEGVKHSVEIGAADGEIDLTELQPGETVQGVVAAEGTFTPAKVTFSKMFGGALIVDVTPA